MSIHIIIDGYNLIRQSTALSRLDQQDIMLGRDALVDMLAAYRKIKPHRITVVFDGRHSPAFSQKRDQKKGIAIRFSRRGESADDLSRHFGTKITIKKRGQRGKVEIEFYSNDDLDRLIERLRQTRF